MDETPYVSPEGQQTDKVLSEMYTLRDVSNEALGQVVRHCALFQRKAEEIVGRKFDASADHDEMYELGVGFWHSIERTNGQGFIAASKSSGDLYSRLHDAALQFTRMSLEVDDDGFIQYIG